MLQFYISSAILNFFCQSETRRNARPTFSPFQSSRLSKRRRWKGRGFPSNENEEGATERVGVTMASWGRGSWWVRGRERRFLMRLFPPGIAVKRTPAWLRQALLKRLAGRESGNIAKWLLWHRHCQIIIFKFTDQNSFKNVSSKRIHWMRCESFSTFVFKF